MNESAVSDPPPKVTFREQMIWRIPYLGAGALGLYFLFGSISLGIGTMAAPGPGLWPFMISIILVTCCIVGLIAATGEDVDGFGSRLIRPALGLITLCCFVLLFPVVGLLLTGVVVLTFWFRFLARESWRMAVGLAVGVTAGSYLLFVVFLGAVFPPDIIAQLWGGR
ncbi:tripartite tricarboxylate transporter TctB family protein [Microbacterium profundi]|uniref:Tripartite tricarboxylate transporter TctB family protein n=1 Tax=Microbacterium profundi TaxID=450380 RepID=A0ABV3LEQ3_9MICO